MEEESHDPVCEIAGDANWTFSGDGGFFDCTERDDSILGDIAPEIGSGFLSFELGDASGLDMVAPPPEKRSPAPPPAPSPSPLSGAGSGGMELSSSTSDPPETMNKVTKKRQKQARQPRFAFMTKSEIDLLEDGYQWRKYGQKAVKNSLFPRSYYRCTNSKCTVKKLIQRSSEDPTIVITTYEGQHCHHSVALPRGGTRAYHAAVFMDQLVPSLHFPEMPLHGNQPMVQRQLAVQYPHKEHYNEGLLDDIMLSTVRKAQGE